MESEQDDTGGDGQWKIENVSVHQHFLYSDMVSTIKTQRTRAVMILSSFPRRTQSQFSEDRPVNTCEKSYDLLGLIAN